MNLLPVAVIAYVLVGLDQAMFETLEVGGCSPRLVIPLLVYVAMYAPARSALWLGLCVGLATDLLSAMTIRNIGLSEPIGVRLIGPNAVGYLVGMYAVIVLRGYMIKRSPGTPPALTLVAASLAGIAAVAIVSFRYQLHTTFRLIDPASWEWRSGTELLLRLGAALYTAIVAIPLSLLFRPLTRTMGLDDTPHRRRN
ncbi:MAG: hypothetical protein AB7K52_15060 [Phycisphaerales bacterium]